MMTGRDHRASSTRSPRVYLYIGEPKTGTTFLREVLWGNRARLAAVGLQLPGYSDRDHSRASRDLRETPRPTSDPADPWIGEWDVLAGQALRTRGRTVISNELLAASSPEQADRAVRSLLRAEVHVVATVRDFAAVLPAEWSEAVKCRGTTGWKAWLDEVTVAERAADRRRRSWFWRVHDTLAILDMWSQHIPPGQVHVVTVPRQQSSGLLWERFAAVMGIDPAGCDLTRARPNHSLGLAETEFLRRINQELPSEMPDWFYTREIKQILAHGVFGVGPRRSKLTLPPSFEAWAAEQAETLIAGLRDARYHIVGDLAELRPAGQAGAASEADLDPGPDSQLGEQFEAAVQAVVALADRYYQVRYPVRQPRRSRDLRQRASDIKWGMLHGRSVRRMLRRASHLAAVRRLRVSIWCVLMRPYRRRRLPAGTHPEGRSTQRRQVTDQPRPPAEPERLWTEWGRAGRTADRDPVLHCAVARAGGMAAPAGYPGGYSSVRDYLARGNAPAPPPPRTAEGRADVGLTGVAGRTA
jgi:hypothetical protein